MACESELDRMLVGLGLQWGEAYLVSEVNHGGAMPRIALRECDWPWLWASVIAIVPHGRHLTLTHIKAFSVMHGKQ